ncbi:B-cell differentiation antigen CD72-like [Alligator mississippiensis]|uniref:B-cell differentiation antigen CD72-like n=1 Tax=Alligator mississippiensis TaxID=8496 RepID=UPI002877A523|nr:B-cell differentiation antigen CD72-like [Alligator mississippiensis]
MADSGGWKESDQDDHATPRHAGPSSPGPVPCSTAEMSEGVTYADLRFSKVPPGRGVAPRVQRAAPAAPGEADDTYENLQLGPMGEGPAGRGVQQCGEPRRSARPLPLVLLAACLALLVTTIALGVCYWQQGQWLQQVSAAHAAERNGLWQQAGAQEQRLGQAGAALVQAQEELARTRAELMRAWQEGNHSQEELQETKAALAWAQEEAQDLRQELNKTATALADVRPCQVTDCCPETWVLHRGKCLFLSKEKKTWLDSKEACAQESSRLLITRDWDHRTMPSFFAHLETSYWIGLRWRWDLRTEPELWQWEDGTPYSFESATGHGLFGIIKRGSIGREGWYDDRRPWVCEKPAGRPQGAAQADPRL